MTWQPGLCFGCETPVTVAPLAISWSRANDGRHNGKREVVRFCPACTRRIDQALIDNPRGRMT